MGRPSAISTISPSLYGFSSSCAWYLRERIIILPYKGCFTRRSTWTKTVLSILLLTTRPRRARCRFSFTGVVCVSVILISYLRSEEHTSELQSRGHLVCRLLLQ